ncbi:MAG: hypothetical protein MUE90_15530, partial [Thermoanaerobaculales bacterium]|nr:hypothetical protein [Thermoanaerobaculales bacterium]
AFVVGPTLVLPLAHAVSVMARARTWWLLLDVIGATAAAVAAWIAMRSLVDVLSPEALYAAGGLLAATLLVALLSAGAAGTVAGRADLRRTHGALSVVLWFVVAAGWTGVGAYLRWLDDFGPRDLHDVSLWGLDPTGSWVEVRGSAALRFDTHRSFIVSTSDERWIALRSLGGSSPGWFGDVSFAADGRAAAWLGSNRDDDARTLWRVDLGRPRPVAVETTITTTSDADLELSADGRMAVLTSTVRCFGEKKRAAETEPRLVLIHELDLASREIRRVAEINLGEHDLRPAFAAYSRALLATIGCPGADCRLRFIDPGSGAIQRETALPAWARAAAVLADGRLVVRSTDSQDEILVAVQAEETATWTEHRAPAESFNWIGGEIAPGRLAILTSRRDDNGDWVKAQVQLLDLDTGATRPLGAGVDAGAGWWWTHEDFWRTSRPMAWKPEAWRLFRTEGGRAVVRWDPATGGLTTVAGRGD